MASDEGIRAVTEGLERMDRESVTFLYTNWRRETRVRRVHPQRIWYGATEFHPEPQWLLRATDMETGEERDFAMKDIKDWAPAGGGHEPGRP